MDVQYGRHAWIGTNYYGWYRTIQNGSSLTCSCIPASLQKYHQLLASKLLSSVGAKLLLIVLLKETHVLNSLFILLETSLLVLWQVTGPRSHLKYFLALLIPFSSILFIPAHYISNGYVHIPLLVWYCASCRQDSCLPVPGMTHISLWLAGWFLFPPAFQAICDAEPLWLQLHVHVHVCMYHADKAIIIQCMTTSGIACSALLCHAPRIYVDLGQSAASNWTQHLSCGLCTWRTPLAYRFFFKEWKKNTISRVITEVISYTSTLLLSSASECSLRMAFQD